MGVEADCVVVKIVQWSSDQLENVGEGTLGNQGISMDMGNVGKWDVWYSYPRLP